MLGFQKRALDIKLLKFHTNQDNNTYLEKCDFQEKLVYQFISKKCDFFQMTPNINKLYTKLKLAKRRVDLY